MSSLNWHPDACTCDDCEDDRFFVQQFQYQLFVGFQTTSMCEHFSKHYFKRPMRDSSLTGHKWVWEFWNGNESRFFQITRMRKHVMRRLIHTLVESYGLDCTSKRVTVEESLAIFLMILGQGVTYPNVEERVQRSSETISNHFHMVLDAVCRLGRKIVRPIDLSFADDPPQLVNNPSVWPAFKGCIGAIDGTHIGIHVPDHEKTPWINRKGVPTTNVLAICDFNMHIMFAQVGMEGSMHDSKVLDRSMKMESRKFPFPPPGKYYLGDAGYPLIRGFLTPYRKTRYHLSEFRANRNLNNANEYFNYKHSSLRSVIERTFGVLKSRWRVLQNMSKVSLDTQMKIIWACITLHNFIRNADTDDLGLLEDAPEEDSELSSTLRRRERDEWFSSQRNTFNEMTEVRDSVRAFVMRNRN